MKRALPPKKRRASTQPVTIHEVLAAKSHDDSDLRKTRTFRGRLLSVPTTAVEIAEVKNGSSPQKYVRPKERTTKEVKKVSKKSITGKPPSLKNVSSRVDSGKSVLSRASGTRSSVRSFRTSKPDSLDGKQSTKDSTSSLADPKTPTDQSNKFMRRSASVRVSGSAGNSVKASADRAHALVESRKAAAAANRKAASNTKIVESIRAKATARVDSRRGSSHSQVSEST